MTQTQTKERSAIADAAAPSVAMTTQIQAPVAIIDSADIPAFIRERDNEAMLAAFMGEVVSTWFYELEISGKKIEGVGVIGAEAFQRIQAERGCPITVVPYGVNINEATQNDERGVRATITMRDARTRRESIGTAFYPHYFVKRNGERKFDDKADRKALSVAKRNAILDLVPQEEILAVLKARKFLIAQNQKRIEEMTQRAIAAAPEVASMAPAKRGDIPGDPYNTPLPASHHTAAEPAATVRKVGPKATEEQVENLLDLIEDPSVNGVTREAVSRGLKIGLSQDHAQRYIDQLREWITAQTKDDVLPLAAGR
jgi:hypothetical protein